MPRRSWDFPEIVLRTSTMIMIGELYGHRDAFNQMETIDSTSIKAKEGMQKARIKYCAKKVFLNLNIAKKVF